MAIKCMLHISTTDFSFRSCFQCIKHRLSLILQAPPTTTHIQPSKDKNQKKQPNQKLLPNSPFQNRRLHISTTSTPYAILDLHFNPHDPHLLAVASSTGSIQLFHLTTTTPASLLPLQTHQFFSPQTLVLSLSWHPTNPSLLGTTLSNGQVHLLNLSTPDAEPKHLLTHELEAWTLAFSPSGEEIYSGGDDAALRFSNNVLIAEEGTALQWCDQRAHTAGVTAILPLVGEENVVLTGSYDDCMRVLYTPLQGRRQVLAEENLEGGVWRLKMLVADAGAGRYVCRPASPLISLTHIADTQS